ncbi:sensor histidine kinase [Clostridium sp. CCUG 7971]|uniref:sensor histidine kinase n=1 Tax=Clostridium sp. CCUG 7971 TaxID=2811414 RepID=UPI001ABA5B45|nr:sensor histidine kinase [Clostridium sp. CCUG 7971]MBO3443384.1 sensor histidine kinase [Clostridium sp. CCUG 7971]
MKGKITSAKGNLSKYSVKRLRQTTINKRLLISFLIISIVPVILIFLVVNTTSVNLIKNNIISNDKVTSKLITDSITNYISKFDSITNEIIWSSTLLNDMKGYNNLTVKERDRFNNELSKILRSRTTYISDIADFTLLNEDFNVVYNEGFSYIKHETKLDEISKAIKSKNIINWTSVTNAEGNYISITKPIKIGKKTYGYIFLALKEKVILEMFKDYNINFNGGGVIVDENNNIVVTNNEELVINKSENLYEQDYLQYIEKRNLDNIEIIKEIDNNTSIGKINGKKFIITSKGISYASWDLLGIIPYSFIYSSCTDIYITYALVAIAMLALSIFIAIIIHKSITKPINEIVYTMNNVEESTIGEEMIISGNDEISFIMQKYNEMSKKLKVLIHTVKLREKEKREVTLRMLQAQINPHFLFNTLGSLRYVAIMNNDNTVGSGLEALAKLLRSIILNKDEFISVNQEIENVKNYITIQKIRYGDSFNIEYFIDESILEEKILKFILQPIVENCILHGFEEANDTNDIKIKLYDGGEFIHFEIIDNGIGIDEERLEEGNFNIDKFAGIGVKNIKERLNLYYEGVYIFEITSKYQNGTITKIVIPKIIGG